MRNFFRALRLTGALSTATLVTAGCVHVPLKSEKSNPEPPPPHQTPNIPQAPIKSPENEQGDQSKTPADPRAFGGEIPPSRKLASLQRLARTRALTASTKTVPIDEDVTVGRGYSSLTGGVRGHTMATNGLVDPRDERRVDYAIQYITSQSDLAQKLEMTGAEAPVTRCLQA